MLERTQRAIVPSCTQVVDPGEKAFFFGRLLSVWGYRKQIGHFPGCNPVPVDRETLHNLATHDYVVAYKTDGVRHMLLLTTRPDGVPVALMIDRALIMYEVEVWGNKHFFTGGTLLDGELTWDGPEERALAFLVFDVVAVSGERCTARPFGDRLQIIHNTIFRMWDSKLDVHQCIAEENRIVCRHLTPVPIQLLPKHMMHMSNLPDMWAKRASSPYRMDGILFTRKDAKVASGSSESILKWKMDASVDLAYCPEHGTGPGALFMHSDAATGLVPLCELGYRFDVGHNKVTEAISAAAEVAIVEYVVRAQQAPRVVALLPLRARRDKTSPNSVNTVSKTISAAFDHVTYPELCATLASNPKNAR